MNRSADDLYRDALAQARGGSTDRAVTLLRHAVARDDRHAPSLHLLGVLAGRRGEQEQCLALLRRAIGAGEAEQAAASAVALAASLRRWGRLGEAEAAYRDAVSRDPASRDAVFGLGLVLQARGDGAGAAAAFGRSIAVDPAFAPAYGALAGVELGRGRLDEAATAAERARALAPADPALTHPLAMVRNAQGRHGEAAALCRAALSGRDDAALLNTLGIALKEQERLDEAVACFARAVAADPAGTDAVFNLALARRDQGRSDDAAALLGALVRQAPGLAAARIALAMVQLPPFHADEGEVARRRTAYADELARLAGYAAANGAGTLADGVGAVQPFYLPYQGGDDAGPQRRYGAIVCAAMAARFPPLPLAAPPRPGERLRLGFVCGHFRDHSVWRIPTRGWVEHLDRARFELFAYHTSGLNDAETVRARGLFDRFVQGPLPLDRWREVIARDRLHAIIFPEVGMDPAVARLAALRLALTQYASWGHPVTTGYPTIDFFLSSAAMEPAGGDCHYAETLIRLPGLSAPIALTPGEPALPRDALGVAAGDIVFWGGQSPAKYLPRYDVLFVRIAQQVPAARFVFVAYPSAELTERFRQRLGAAFARAGLDAREHCVILPRLAARTYNAAMAAADIVLDSPGWSGCNSLIEAIGHGLPVVTLPGETMRSRHGAAILRVLGCRATICADEAEFVAVAVELALDQRKRERIRAAILRNRPRLGERAAVTSLENHLLHRSQRPIWEGRSCDPPAPR